MKSLSPELRPFLWFLVPLIVYSAVLVILARLINHGLIIATWSDWRICLFGIVAILCINAAGIWLEPKARYITAGLCIAPWVIYGLLAALNMFIDWQIYWPPLDWFKNAAVGSVFTPIAFALGTLGTYSLTN